MDFEERNELKIKDFKLLRKLHPKAKHFT